MSELPRPPKQFMEFNQDHPTLAKAWELIAEAGKEGPLDEKTARLIKLGIAIGAMREGAVHASVRKARALGITSEELTQVVNLAAGTLGMPATVAVAGWIKES